jgi:hypothetical protein
MGEGASPSLAAFPGAPLAAKAFESHFVAIDGKILSKSSSSKRAGRRFFILKLVNWLIIIQLLLYRIYSLIEFR